MSEREAVAVAILNYNVKHGTALGLLSSDDAYSLADTVLAALAARLPDREAIGRAIYLAEYAHKGGKWEYNETKEVWYEMADRFIRFLHPEQQSNTVKNSRAPEVDGNHRRTEG